MAHVTFIHGIGNKPPADVLHEDWKSSLAADTYEDPLSLDAEGVTSSMVYWADVLYEEPSRADEASEIASEGLAGAEPTVKAPDWNREQLSGREREFVESLARRIENDEPGGGPQPEGFVGPEDAQEELIPLPWALKRPLMEILLRDVHHYMFDSTSEPRAGKQFQVQQEIRGRFVRALQEGAELAGDGPHIVVSHSMGTVIAYDCLKRVPDCPRVAALMTIGAPLGLDEIQHLMKPEWSKHDGYPHDRVAGADAWTNVYDRFDVVAALDPKLANDYRLDHEKVVQDIREQNWGKWRHDIAKYLRGPKLRRALRGYLDRV